MQNNSSLIENMIAILENSGVSKIFLVLKNNVQFPDFPSHVQIVINSELTNLSSSGSAAAGFLETMSGGGEGCTLLIDGDLYFSQENFDSIYSYLNGNSILLTPHTGSGDECVPHFNEGKFIKFSKEKNTNAIDNPEYIGLSHFSGSFIECFLQIAKEESYVEAYENLIPKIVEIGHPISFIYKSNFLWKDLDYIEDIEAIRKLQTKSNEK